MTPKKFFTICLFVYLFIYLFIFDRNWKIAFLPSKVATIRKYALE